ncbi:hypothetical protein HANVADRAFT_736 [Hanseniaspora valbyensis NRRL Y-1626]|uniref:GIT Spa2 homology (SHD) domain-containing protein n=1 Tax=Hanseniaspora valbyensis NRRL Y-1626 TaxID=766949 RepID=A0A1B7TIL6_9ASCO|nr:hypothetical protein HANVADRAFT_736 [Hanseniaspora valbyensis NRRL Y-1626]
MSSISVSNVKKALSVSKNVHLSSNDRNSMFHYYMTLNKYFHSKKDTNQNGDEIDRSTSSRAVKARKRLLNLSTYQFFELTTDVNDEVERRMNTDLNGEYLLPKENLHLKRNQARQKLANLSQKRFLDLVDDLSYEIRRRQYDLDPQFDAPFEDEEDDDDEEVEVEKAVSQENKPVLKELTPAIKHSNLGTSTTATDLRNETEEINKSLTNKPSVQQVNVKTANLDWSDDEEIPQTQAVNTFEDNEKPVEKKRNSEEDFNLPEGFSKRSLNIQNTSQTSLSKKSPVNAVTAAASSIIPNGKRTSQLIHPLLKNNDEKEKKLQAAYDEINTKHSSLLAKSLHLTKEHSTLEENYKQLLVQNENLSKEFKVNEDIIQELKTNLENTKKQYATKEYQAKDYASMISKVEQLSIENETLKQQLMDLEIKDQLLDTAYGFKTKLLDENDISSFTEEHSSNNGLVPIQSVKDFQNSIQQFYLKLQSYKQKENNKTLFLEATKVCDIVANIVKIVEYNDDNQLFTENCILVNTTSTHLLTTLRYQSKFSDIFPKIIIQNALLEVVGGVYKLIYKAGCKISEDFVASDDGFENNHINSSKNSTSNLLAKNITSLKDDKDDAQENDESPVRPLKITQRLSSYTQLDDIEGSTNNNQNIPQSSTSNRKHSNNGLFTGMILTATSNKSENNLVASSSSSNNNNTAGNKNVKNLSLSLKDETTPNKNVTVTTPKNQVRTFSAVNEENTSKNANTSHDRTTPNKSQNILNKVKVFEDNINSSKENTPEKEVNAELSSSINKGNQRVPSRSSLEISNLQKRNSLQSIEDRATAFGEFKHKSSNGSVIEQNDTVSEEKSKQPIVNHEETEKHTTELSASEKDLNNLLHYLESESIEVISTIQSLLTSIKNPNATIVELNSESRKIMQVVNKVCNNTLSSIEKNNDLKTIGEYIITSLQDCERRMKSLIETDSGSEYPDKSFKQRLAGIAFDIAKNVKKLVKIVEELSLKKEIDYLDKQLG